MNNSKRIFTVFLLLFITVIFLTTGCLQQYTQPTARVDHGIATELPPYRGPRARLAVAKFQWKVGSRGRTTRISGIGQRDITISRENQGAMSGLQDMLTTALVQSGRFMVLERQEFGSIKDEIGLGEEGYVEESSAIKKGKVKGAEILVVAAITGWSPGSSGTGVGIGGIGGGVIGGVMGSVRKSSLVMDIRIIDTSTSEVLAATRIEGEAKDIKIGFLGGGFVGGGALGVGLSSYANTPMEKAIRIAINESVKYIVSATPPQYMKH